VFHLVIGTSWRHRSLRQWRSSFLPFRRPFVPSCLCGNFESPYPLRLEFTTIIILLKKTTIHQDNAGAPSLSNLEPGRITPRLNHFAVTLHWCKSKLDPAGNHPIIMVMQRANILTNQVQFQAIRKLLHLFYNLVPFRMYA
jgi:hypothetical protein